MHMGKKKKKGAAKPTRPPKPRRPADPAKVSYLFGPGFADISRVIRSTTDKARTNIDDMTRAAVEVSEGTTFDSMIVRAGWTACRYVYWLACCLGMVVTSVVFCVGMLLPQVIAFLCYELVGATLCGIAWLTDTMFLAILRISNVCDYCHKRFARPVYQCPNCGAKHRDLFPGRYGILHHTCQCGQKLPSSVLDRRRPRRKLTALCPYCLAAGHDEIIRSAGSRTICIPVVGGASSGKTSFINAYAVSMITSRAGAHGLTTRFYDKVREQRFATMMADSERGFVDKTAVETDEQRASAFSMSFYLDGAGLRPSRLMQLLDIAGETFVRGAENEQQNQYAHCEGIVLVIDPLAIPQVKARVASGLRGTDAGSISASPLGDVMNALHNDIDANLTRNRGKRLTTPLAVVINKVDAAPLLDERLGAPAIARFRQAEPERCANDLDTMDFLCRQFLVDMDMGDVVDMIQQQFATSRFFAVSAIGHTAGEGRFMPRGVDDVIDWIVSLSDPALAKALAIHEFPKTKLPVFTPDIGRFEGIPAEAAQRERERIAQEQAKAQAKADRERAKRECKAPGAAPTSPAPGVAPAPAPVPFTRSAPAPVPPPTPIPSAPEPVSRPAHPAVVPTPSPQPARRQQANPVPMPQAQPIQPAQQPAPQPARRSFRPQRTRPYHRAGTGAAPAQGIPASEVPLPANGARSGAGRRDAQPPVPRSAVPQEPAPRTDQPSVPSPRPRRTRPRRTGNDHDSPRQ